MRHPLLPVSLLLALHFTAIGVSRAALADEPSLEARVKGAFIFNFVQFTSWPDGTFPKADSPIIVGIVGTTSVSQVLDAIAAQKLVNGRRIELHQFNSTDDLTACHVVILGPDMHDNADRIMRAIRSKEILTIADFDGFTDAGGIIQFFVEDNKERFEVNTLAAERAHLQLSSKLLKLAKVVRK